MKKLKIKPSTITHMIKFFSFSKTPVRSIIAILTLGISLGVAYEEMVGIGTWHSFGSPTNVLNVCFTPPSGCGSLIAREIARAKKTIFVQAYGLTSTSIIHQLKVAKDRGVRVRILLDGGNLSDNQSIYNELIQYGIEVKIDKMPGIAHNKVMIIDQRKVITGSFNFTGAADHRNAENVLLIDDIKIAAKYLENWLKRSKEST